jgi:hypothetical protein
MDTEKHTQLLMQVVKQFFTEDILNLIQNMVAIEAPKLDLRCCDDSGIDVKPRINLMHLMKDYAQQYLAQQDLPETERQQQLFTLFKLLDVEMDVIEAQVRQEFYDRKRRKFYKNRDRS